MEGFTAVGIGVSALLTYAFATFIVTFIATGCGDQEERIFWIIAWILGGIMFSVTVICWAAGFPFP